MRQKTMIARERLRRWEDLLFQADCAQGMGANKITAEIDLLQEIDRYIQYLHGEVEKKTVIVGFGCGSADHFDVCDSCGSTIEEEGAIVNDLHGKHHVECFAMPDSE
jgi:hypothetical protein